MGPFKELGSMDVTKMLMDARHELEQLVKVIKSLEKLERLQRGNAKLPGRPPGSKNKNKEGSHK